MKQAFNHFPINRVGQFFFGLWYFGWSIKSSFNYMSFPNRSIVV